MRSPGRYDKKWIFFLQARPARRQSRHVAAMVSIEKQIVAIVYTPLNTVEILPQQGMKGVRNSDGCSYFSGAACSSSIVRTRASLTQPTYNSADGCNPSFPSISSQDPFPAFLHYSKRDLSIRISHNEMARCLIASGRREKIFPDILQD